MKIDNSSNSKYKKTTQHIYAIEKYFDTHSQYLDIVYKSEDITKGFVSYEMRERKKYIINLLNSYIQNSYGNILDCGCGGGGIIIDLIEHGYNVVGIDISYHQLLKAKDNIHNSQLASKSTKSGIACLIQANSEKLPFQDNTFDVILCVGVLQYLPDDR